MNNTEEQGIQTYRLSSPEHLYCVAKLFKLKPNNYRSARILALGCGNGSNIIPFAAYYPEATLIGVDSCAHEITKGQAYIDQLGLKNIQLLNQSLLTIDRAFGTFDYIICQNIYSMVEEPLRNKILSICQENLAEDGIAYISYNTLPCWNMIRSIRDMMLYHVAHFEGITQKTQQARLLLNFLLESLGDEKTPYAKFFREEVDIISKTSDYSLYHDYLNPVNYPCYFYQFIDHANKNGLTYLSDSYIPMMYPGNLKDKFKTQIESIKDVVKTGQYMDFIRNQRSRSTLLCHKSQTINRNLTPADLYPFYLSYIGGYKALIPEADLSEGTTLEFEIGTIKLTLTNRFAKIVMKILHDRYGCPISYDALLKEVVKQTQLDVAKAQHLMDVDLNLIRLLLAGFITIHADEAFYTDVLLEKPKTTPLIQLMAGISNQVPNCRHETYALNPVEKCILQAATGDNTVSDFHALIENKIHQKELNLTDENKVPVTEPEKVNKYVQNIIAQTLDGLVKKAYFVSV